MTVYRDRADAGSALARLLSAYGGRENVVVLALPRGGVPVGAAVAAALGAPLDVLVVRKLGVPGYEELAMGAIASGGVRVRNDDVLAAYPDAAAALDDVAAREAGELMRREGAYRGDRPPANITGRVVLLVDDGLATGSTMAAAVRAARARQPARVVVAVPVAAPEAARRIGELADDVVVVAAPRDFRAVGLHYGDFTQTTDFEVRALLDAHGVSGT